MSRSLSHMPSMSVILSCQAPSSLWSLIPERCGHWNVKSCALPNTDAVCAHYSEMWTVTAIPTQGVCAKIISCHQSAVER